jgi:hypothetical protein
MFLHSSGEISEIASFEQVIQIPVSFLNRYLPKKFYLCRFYAYTGYAGGL